MSSKLDMACDLIENYGLSETLFVTARSEQTVAGNDGPATLARCCQESDSAS